MKKILCIMLAAIMFVGCQEEGDKEIRVGVILPLSGDIAFMGEMLKNAMLMNAKNDSVELFFEDSRGEAKTAISIVNNLLSIKKCNVIVSFLPPVSEAINPICEKNNVLHFVFAFSPNIVKNTNVIKQFPSSDYEAQQFLSYIKDTHAKRVVYFRHLYPDAEYAYNNIVAPQLSSQGVNVIDITHEQTCEDFRNLAMKAKMENPDLVVVQSLSLNYSNILTALQNAQIDNIILDLNCVDFYGDTSNVMIKLQKIPFVGMDFVLSPKFDEFMRNYQSLYNKKPYVFGAFAYDLMTVINNLKETGLIKRDIIEYYSKNSVEGITGVIEYDNDGNQNIEYKILQYNDGNVSRAE